ncbi:hypothetical protein OSSY52_06320 [Tepiditoga spiralis]|uniref:Uncharacterized protein n=1 Tax=Tepiditoga spiralis TaxID=2108365 RepID=A0A7G1G2E3_9BACT|nr:hypothetical protein [Tepiditoga spiralis]BBE30491.1 hypothetical protein OSSY52_06320 [Tepiditoga spiralis]
MYNCAVFYGDYVGVVDIRSISEHFKKGFAKKVVLFIGREPVKKAAEMLKENDYIEVKIVKKPSKSAKEYFKSLNNSFLSDLNEFGERAMMFDPC